MSVGCYLDYLNWNRTLCPLWVAPFLDRGVWILQAWRKWAKAWQSFIKFFVLCSWLWMSCDFLSTLDCNLNCELEWALTPLNCFCRSSLSQQQENKLTRGPIGNHGTHPVSLAVWKSQIVFSPEGPGLLTSVSGAFPCSLPFLALFPPSCYFFLRTFDSGFSF